MITKVYAHILDEDRMLNGQKFEAAFYTNPDFTRREAAAGERAGYKGTYRAAAEVARTC
jgi:hypothetical protein